MNAPYPIVFLLAALCALPRLSASEAATSADVRDVLSVPVVSGPRLSPDGVALLFTRQTADWSGNRFDTEIYISREGETPAPLTNNPDGSSTDPRWSPDGRYVGYLADRGRGMQVYRQSVRDGDIEQVTAWPGGLLSFEWSPDGRHMALLIVNPNDAAIAQRDAEYAQFEMLGESKLTASLWLVDIDKAIAAGGAHPTSTAIRRLTDGREFSVAVFSVDGLRPGYAFSPNGESIVFSHGRSIEILDSIHSDVSVVDLESGHVRRLSSGADWDETPLFSPDGSTVLFARTVTADWLSDRKLMLVPAAGGDVKELEVHYDGRDRQPALLGWTRRGIDVFFLDGTAQAVHRIDPESGDTSALVREPHVVSQFTSSADGTTLAFAGFDGLHAPEIYRGKAGKRPQPMTAVSQTLRNWPPHKVEVIRWHAEDGVTVEGILYSPGHPAVDGKTPLIVLLHGGPREAANPRRLHNQEYPVEQWLARGARVLVPNYRGSLGYGEQFRKLTMRNIGHAESRDVLAGIAYLVERGLADADRVAVVGHSWGGYLAAFLSVSTTRFRAASVGSAITDHRINYVLSRAGVAREGYLASLPWEEPVLWNSASPVSYVGNASTPTLIQHGDNDFIVPVTNAHVFYRGLRDRGVASLAVIFRNTGHSVDRPREKLAWMEQNLQWFDEYLFESGR